MLRKTVLCEAAFLQGCRCLEECAAWLSSDRGQTASVHSEQMDHCSFTVTSIVMAVQIDSQDLTEMHNDFKNTWPWFE